MKFILQVKDPESQNILSEVEYDSIRKIFLHFKGAHTYCNLIKNIISFVWTHKNKNIKIYKKINSMLY